MAGRSLEKNYRALLFGETGSGKSTFINYVTNLFREGTLDDLKIAIPTKFQRATEEFRSNEKDLSDSTKSKTKDCMDYEFKMKDELENTTFRFIDTPGLSDTEGVSKDDENLDKIMAAAEETGQLAAAIIVINGTVARATINLRNTLIRMRGFLPDIMLNNLLVVLTNCSVSSYNFELDSLAPWTVPKENVFFMNNSALSRCPTVWRRDVKIRKNIQREWEDSMEEVRRLVQKITELGQTATTAFKVMREKREAIKAEMCTVLLETKKLQLLYDELQSSEMAKTGIAEDIKKYSNFKENKVVQYDVLEDAAYHSLICMMHTSKVCQEHCGFELNPGGIVSAHVCTSMFGTVSVSTPFLSVDTSPLNRLVFGGNAINRLIFRGTTTCTGCKCGYEHHFHARKKLTKLMKSVENILHDVKAQFDLCTGRTGDLEKKISTLQADLSYVKQALIEKGSTISDYCKQLKSICSHYNFVGELKSVIDTMEANARTLTSMHARKEADMMIENIKILVDRLSSGKNE